jgi:hypothetical protein
MVADCVVWRGVACSPAKYPPIEAWKHLIEKHEASTKGVKM